MFKVTLAREIALRSGGSKTRRRSVLRGDGTVEVMVFGRKPVFLEKVPPEVANDPQLIVAEVAVPASGQALAGVVLDTLDYAALVKLAKDLGIPSSGRKADLHERLQDALDARAAAEG